MSNSRFNLNSALGHPISDGAQDIIMGGKEQSPRSYGQQTPQPKHNDGQLQTFKRSTYETLPSKHNPKPQNTESPNPR